MSFDASPLVRAAGGEWRAATTARFLDAIRDGDLPDSALDRWLVQDRIFVSGLFRFQAAVLSKAPEDARGPLLGGIVALQGELEWFDGLARRRGLAPAEPHPVCDRFTDFLLRSAHEEPFSRLAQTLFAVEVCYFAAWSAVAGPPRPGGIHGELIDRWSSPAFADYVADLLRVAEDHPHPDDDAFRRVLRFERDFWRMTWEG